MDADVGGILQRDLQTNATINETIVRVPLGLNWVENLLFPLVSASILMAQDNTRHTNKRWSRTIAMIPNVITPQLCILRIRPGRLLEAYSRGHVVSSSSHIITLWLVQRHSSIDQSPPPASLPRRWPRFFLLQLITSISHFPRFPPSQYAGNHPASPLRSFTLHILPKVVRSFAPRFLGIGIFTFEQDESSRPGRW